MFCLPDGGRVDPVGSIASRRSRDLDGPRNATGAPDRLTTTTLPPRGHGDRASASACETPPSTSDPCTRSAPVDLDVAPGEVVTCSGRAAAARRRCSAWSRASNRRPAARSPSTASHRPTPGVTNESASSPRPRRSSPGAPSTRTPGLLRDLRPGHNPSPSPDPTALLEQVGLADFSGAYPHELSGGMQQRVALGASLRARSPLPPDGRAVRRPRRNHPRRHAAPAWPSCASRSTPPWCSSPTPSPSRCSCRIVWWCCRRGRVASSAPSTSISPIPGSPRRRTTRRSSNTNVCCVRCCTPGPADERPC